MYACMYCIFSHILMYVFMYVCVLFYLLSLHYCAVILHALMYILHNICFSTGNAATKVESVCVGRCVAFTMVCRLQVK